jgi:hypothetical protein
MPRRRFSLAAALALVTLVFLSVAAQAPAAAPGDLLWARFGAVTINTDSFYDVARCPDGGVVAVGLTNAPGGSVGDGLVCKYSPSGFPEWRKEFDYDLEGREDVFTHVAVDRHGNVVAAGWHDSSATGHDYLVVRFDKSGAVRWSRAVDGYSLNDDLGGLVLDSAGNACVTGRVGRPPSRSYLGTYKLRAADGDTMAANRWKGPSGSVGFDVGSIARGSGGTLFVTGATVNGVGAGRIVLVKYKSNGNRLWTRSYLPSGASSAHGSELRLGPDGSPYILAGVDRLSGADDVGLVKYSPGGTRRFTRRFAYAKDSHNGPRDLAIDRRGNIFTASSAVPKSGLSMQGCLIKWSAAGARRWVRLYPRVAGNSVEYRALLADQAGGVYLAGSMRSAATGDVNGLMRHVGTGGGTIWSRVSLHTGARDRFDALAFCGSTGICAAGHFLAGVGDDDAYVEKRRK